MGPLTPRQIKILSLLDTAPSGSLNREETGGNALELGALSREGFGKRGGGLLGLGLIEGKIAEDTGEYRYWITEKGREFLRSNPL